MTARFLDVSHTVQHGVVTYPGFPTPVICDWMSRAASRERYAPGTEFQIGRIDMIANTGTYVDSPFHRYENGTDLSELPLESVAELPCVVVHVDSSASRAIDVLPLSAAEVSGKAILFHTGWDRHYNTPAYGQGHPFVSARAAEWLAQSGAALVGIDSMNIDSTDTGERAVHSILLAREIPICEHMTGLAQVPERGGVFSAVPVKVKGMGTFPVRAYVRV